MEPTYKSGDWLMAKWGGCSIDPRPKLFATRVKVGDVVVIERDQQPGILYVKRISEINLDERKIYLLSDNPEGTDSRTWGWLPAHTISAKVTGRIRRSRS